MQNNIFTSTFKYFVILGHLKTAIFLLEKGADATKRSDKGDTLLHAAATNKGLPPAAGSKELLKLLVSNGAGIHLHASSPLVGMPLHLAAAVGNHDALEYLLELGADAGANPNGHSLQLPPIFRAITGVNGWMVSRLLEAGADPNKIDFSGKTPLEHAALIGFCDAVEQLFPLTSPIAGYPDWSPMGFVKHLVSEKATVLKPAEVVNEEGHTALHLATAAGSTDICNELIKAFKLDVNALDNLGNTPLIISILEKRNSVAKYLIENGAGIMIRAAKANTPLHCAAAKGNEEIVKLLISKGAAVEAMSEDGTPLQCAALAGKKGTLKILMDNKANPNPATPLLYTPLMLSICANSFDCFQLLIKAGADPNLASCTKTPLIVAACEGQTKIIKCLLKLEANPNATDAVGVTALEHAAMRGQVEAVAILFQVTSPLSFFPDWSVMGIMKHVFSEEAREQRENRRKALLETAKSKGRDAFKRKDYTDAIFWYTEANLADPADASVLSNRSLCWARLNQGKQALSDAEMCVELDPKSAKAHYREGAAWMLLEEYSYTSEAFTEALKFDPTNEEIKKAHREAVQAEFGVEVSENMRVVRL